MTEKLKALRNFLEAAKEGETELKVFKFQSVFNCLLIKKHFENNVLTKIEVRTLENGNPDYEKNQILKVDLNDNGIIEIINLLS